MPNLAQVVGSVLSDATAAQHLANEASARLAPIYRRHEILRHYPLPNVAMQEVDLELKFAFADGALLTAPPATALAEAEAAGGRRQNPSEPVPAGALLEAKVVVQADQLANLPEQAIQTLRLSLVVRDFRWMRSPGGLDELIAG